MGQCQLCKKKVEMPFTCSYCGQTFCSEHRLPENHQCPALPKFRDRSWIEYKSLKLRTDKIIKKPAFVPSNPPEYPWSEQNQPNNSREKMPKKNS